jgi:purine-binding chemotaxis protein CheW
MATDLIDVLARDDGQIEVITLIAKGVEFCLDIKAVREIRGWTPATPAPIRRPTSKGLSIFAAS